MNVRNDIGTVGMIDCRNKYSIFIDSVSLFKWYARQEAKQDEALSWDDFERELEARNMRK